jgi:predicted MFS family arabinose efflux permease
MKPLSTKTALRARIIVVLGITQTIGWGTTYDMPGALGRRMAASLQLPAEIIFSGLTAMMLTMAFSAPFVGEWIRRFGAARILPIGSTLIAVGLLGLAASEGTIFYLASWLMIGLGGATGLTLAANTAAVEREGAEAREAIGLIMIFTAISSGLFWPVLSYGADYFGWRTVLCFAAFLHLAICLPLHLWGLPALPPTLGSGETDARRRPPLDLTTPQKLKAFILIAVTVTLFSFIGFGLAPSMLELLNRSGASPTLALQLGSMASFLGIFARFSGIISGRRNNSVLAAIIASILQGAGFVVLMFMSPGLPGILAFVGFYAIGGGIATVTRALLPLGFFAPDEYARYAGRLSTAQSLANAVAPVIFTALLDRGGTDAVLMSALALSTGALVSMILAKRLENSAKTKPQATFMASAP